MTDAHNGTPLPADFEETQQDWCKAAAKVFARVHKKDVADVPLDIWKRLIRTTYDEIKIKPLFTRADELEEAPEPGKFPYLRGSQGPSAKAEGWGVTERFGAEGDAKTTNEKIMHALNYGTNSLVLDLRGDDHIAPADLKQALDKVLFAYAPVRLEAGKDATEAAKALLSLAEGQEKEEGIRIEFGASPLTSTYDESESVSMDEAIELAKLANDAKSDARAILVDGVAFSNQGASDGEEVGFVLAAAVEYLRKLVDAGLSVEEAFNQLSFRFAATDEQFNQITKFRAARILWARVAEVLGVPELAAHTPQHAITAPIMFTQRDPWVNMLRSTVAAFSAGVGGATDMEVLPFDFAIKGGLPNTSRDFVHRIARNTNLLLIEESHLGYVIDPAGGAYYAEKLTQEVAEVAWKIFTEVEAKGGFSAAADYVRETLDATSKVRYEDISRRKKSVTAINEFPNLAEKPLSKEARTEPKGVRRWAAEFEAMRNRSDDYLEEHGVRPTVGLIPLGPLAKHNIRTGWITNLVGTGGIAVNNPGQVVPGEDGFKEAADAADILIICGNDKEYEASGLEALKALRETGKTILLAGSEKSFEGKEDAPDGYLNVKINAGETLSDMLTKLGA